MASLTLAWRATASWMTVRAGPVLNRNADQDWSVTLHLLVRVAVLVRVAAFG